ncbi:toll/interleukin-1 receptor domain-containing protein [Streptomyces cyaneofuscatus]|uniref:toll/interleukin-1 receptor domain-containing protein n=1 Tax=Streptomyces cyaneofuscatus TaxID=66883 RepID=UPI002E0FEC29|nr:toll/interleukin-1 receptor domain-containing protein [Streptomyces cyaneofuscatus]
MHGDVDVFINYRTADAGYGAAACYELLAPAFGDKRVFRDCVSMLPGELYPQRIRQALEQARILLVLIGPDWLAEDPAGGGRLVDREDDWVRREIRRAFERGIPVVQVLLDGARPVESNELPFDIARLALCQAAHVAHRSLGDDVRRLADEITELVPELRLPDLFVAGGELPADPLPSMLLQADYGVVPFERVDDELPLLIDWLSDLDHLAARLLTGPGGQGKTRLANRLVEQMRGLGWAAGLLAEQVPEPVLGRVHAFRGRVLIVVDYAEGRTDQIATLASELIARPAEHGPARLLLLARSAGVWPHLLRRHRDDRISLLFTDLAERVLPPVVAAPDDRPAEYARALHAFATRLGHPVPAVTVPDGLGSARYDRVLDVHAAALAALLDGAQPDTTPARRDPLLRVLDHERRYWAAAAVPHELPAPGSARHDQVVSAGTLFTAPSRAAARALLASLPTFDREGYEVTERHLRWLDALYPGPEALNPLRPDRLGEDLVATTLLDQPEFVESVAAVVGEVQVTRALTVLGRAAPRHPHVGKAMATLLTADPAARLPLAIAVATQLQDTVLVDVLNEVSASAAGLGLDLEEAVTDHLPDSSLALAAYMVVSTRAALGAELHKEQPDVETVATHTHNLSLRLSAVGQHDSALVHAAQAVEIYEEMAHAEPEFTPELGSALSSLASAYSQSGFAEEGLDAAARSCALLSRVAGGSPENLQRYATALTNHGNMLSDVARHTEAVAAAERALELATELHDGATEKDRVDRLYRSANAQYSLSVIRAGAGLHDGALAAAEEAVRIYRDLDGFSSDRFRDDLVQALGHLSGAHSELGQTKEAADIAAASVRLARDLVDRHGDGYLHLMADVLNNSGVALRRVGRYDDAVAQLTEAVALYRTLATSSPAHQLPALAGALYNLGNCMLDTGQLNKACDVYDESIDIYRKLVDPRPDTNEPDLTDSLLALADVLHEQGEYEEALELAAEAAAILRRLAESGGVVLRRKFARALHLLALVHHDMGRPSEARDPAASAARHLGELVASEPEDLPELRGEWAAALLTYARVLDGAGFPDRAVEPFARATEVLRALIRESDDAADHALLGDVLQDHAVSLSALGQHEEALAHIVEAVRIRRRQDQASAAGRLALCQSLNNLADTLNDLGRHTDALVNADEAVELAAALREEDDGELLVYTLVTRASARAGDERSAVGDLVRAWHAALTARDDALPAVVLGALGELDGRRPRRVRRAWQALTSQPYPLPRR